jgi:proline iminopeptidase
MKFREYRVVNIVFLVSFFLFVRCDMKKSAHIEEGFIEVNGLELYYKTIGEGEAVVILHGGPGFDHIHMLPMRELAKEYKVIFYDQRSTGNSTGNVDSASITVDNFVEDLESLRKKMNLEKMNLIGHSWGASLGMFYGIKHPNNLETLILLAPSASTEYFEQYLKNIQERTSPEDSLALKEIEQSEAFKNKEVEAVQRYYRTAIKPLFFDPFLAGRVDFTFGKNTAKNQNVVAALLMKNLGNYDVHDELSAIKCPTLIVHGDSDPIPVEAPYKAHKHVPQSKFVILKNTGHFIFIESPNELFSIIRNFLRDDSSVETSIPLEIEAKLKSILF